MADEYWTSPVNSTSYEPPTVTVVPLADLEKCRNELVAAQLTIRSLTNALEQAEKHVEDRDARIGDLAADLVETRAQRDEFMRERDLALQNARAVALYAEERQRERDEARDEVARLNATIVRLTNGGSIDG